MRRSGTYEIAKPKISKNQKYVANKSTVHMVRCELILKQDGAICSGSFLNPPDRKMAHTNKHKSKQVGVALGILEAVGIHTSAHLDYRVCYWFQVDSAARRP